MNRIKIGTIKKKRVVWGESSEAEELYSFKYNLSEKFIKKESLSPDDLTKLEQALSNKNLIMVKAKVDPITFLFASITDIEIISEDKSLYLYDVGNENIPLDILLDAVTASLSNYTGIVIEKLEYAGALSISSEQEILEYLKNIPEVDWAVLSGELNSLENIFSMAAQARTDRREGKTRPFPGRIKK